MAKRERSTHRQLPEWTMKVTLTATGESFYRLADGRMVDDDFELILPTTHPDAWKAMTPNARVVYLAERV